MNKPTKSDAVKTAKSTTPATLAPSPATKPKATAKSTKLKSSPAASIPASNAPAVRSWTTPPVPTTIVAQIDVGFGNTLFLRGEGPGLSWEKGVPLDCVADDKWSISLSETSKPIVFKFLINDQTWCVGEDYVSQPGTTATVSPAF